MPAVWLAEELPPGSLVRCYRRGQSPCLPCELPLSLSFFARRGRLRAQQSEGARWCSSFSRRRGSAGPGGGCLSQRGLCGATQQRWACLRAFIRGSSRWQLRAVGALAWCLKACRLVCSFLRYFKRFAVKYRRRRSECPSYFSISLLLLIFRHFSRRRRNSPGGLAALLTLTARPPRVCRRQDRLPVRPGGYRRPPLGARLTSTRACRARLKLTVQDKNKYNTPKYRMVVRIVRPRQGLTPRVFVATCRRGALACLTA